MQKLHEANLDLLRKNELLADLMNTQRATFNGERVRLERESQQRKAELERLHEEVEKLRRITERNIHERDVVLAALRNLFNALPGNDGSLLKYFAGSPLEKAHREAKELLAIIDATQKARGE